MYPNLAKVLAPSFSLKDKAVVEVSASALTRLQEIKELFAANLENNPDIAETAAKDFLQCVGRLQNYGWDEVLKTGKFAISLHADGSPLSFSIYWTAINNDAEKSTNYGFSGGLLYHGPGNRSFAVQIGDFKYWSIHS